MIARIFEVLFQGFFDRVLAFARGLLRGLLRAPLTAAEHVVRPIEVRPARFDEIVHVRHAVLRAGRPRSSAVFDGDTAPTTRHWAADRNGIVVGVVTVLACPLPEGTPDAPPAPPGWQLRGLAVLPQYRGSGLGAALLRTTHVEVGEPMWCNAREAVVPFYAAHGWRPLGLPFDIPEVGPHQRMWWPGP